MRHNRNVGADAHIRLRVEVDIDPLLLALLHMARQRLKRLMMFVCVIKFVADLVYFVDILASLAPALDNIVPRCYIVNVLLCK